MLAKIKAWALGRIAKRNCYTDTRTFTGTMPEQFVPPVGSMVNMGGFVYRVRKITGKDLILRPVGNK